MGFGFSLICGCPSGDPGIFFCNPCRNKSINGMSQKHVLHEVQLYTYQLFKNTRVELTLLLAALIEVLVLDIQALPMLFELGVAVVAKLLDTREV